MAAIKEEITPEIVTPHFMDTDADGDLKPEIKLEIEHCGSNSSVQDETSDISKLEPLNRKQKLQYCGLCDFQATSRYTIIHHNNTVHMKDGLHICPLCNKKVQRKDTLKIHLVKEHRNEVNSGQLRYVKKIYQCPYCDYQTILHHQLSSHMLKHGAMLDGVPKFECDQCEFIAFTNFTLNRHKKTHLKRGKPFKCTVCDQGFYMQKYLDFHMLTYHTVTKIEVESESKPSKPTKRIYRRKVVRRLTKCKLCEFRGNSKIAVRKHIKKVHLSFTCEACEKTFISLLRLESHILKHHRFEDTFLARLTHKVLECEKCTFMSLAPSNMQYHINRNHPLGK